MVYLSSKNSRWHVNNLLTRTNRRSVAFHTSQDHVLAGRESDTGIGMSGAIIKKLRQFIHGGCGGLGMFSGKFADRGEQGGLDGPCVEQKGAVDFENPSFIGGIEGRSGVWEGRKLGLGTVVGALPGMRGIFRCARTSMLETFEGGFDVPRH